MEIGMKIGEQCSPEDNRTEGDHTVQTLKDDGYILHHRTAGFTLIEVLVALAIFSVIGLLSYRGLDTIVSTKAHLDQEMQFWRKLGLVFERMEIDLEQIAPSPWLGEDGRWNPSFSGTNTPEGESCQLDFVRFQGGNQLVHVTYRLEEKKWTLQMEPRLLEKKGDVNTASSPRSVSQTYLLLDTVTRCELQFLDSNRRWQKSWRSRQQDERPQGLKIILKLEGRGSFERVFYLL